MKPCGNKRCACHIHGDNGCVLKHEAGGSFDTLDVSKKRARQESKKEIEGEINDD